MKRVIKISQKSYIEDSVIQNLLVAHKRLAVQGDAEQVIKLSDYVLKLANNRKDKLFELRGEKDQQGTHEPPYKST